MGSNIQYSFGAARYPVSASYHYGTLRVTYSDNSVEEYEGYTPWQSGTVVTFGPGEVYCLSGQPGYFIYEENGYTVSFYYQPTSG